MYFSSPPVLHSCCKIRAAIMVWFEILSCPQLGCAQLECKFLKNTEMKIFQWLQFLAYRLPSIDKFPVFITSWSIATLHSKRPQITQQQTSNCHRYTAPANWLKWGTKVYSAEIPSDEHSLNRQGKMKDVLDSTIP